MLSPRYLSGLSDELVEIYSQLETDILQDMARRISKAGKAGDMDKWQAQIMAEAGGLKADIDKILKKYDKTVASTVKAVVQDALEKNTENDNRIFFDALGRKVSPPTAQAMLATIQKCYSDLSRLTLTTAATSEQQFVRQANRFSMQVKSGAFDYDTALRHAVDTLAAEGVTAVQYENGKPVRRSVESAVRMNILTSVNHAAAQMTLNNCDELDCDLVETSAHIGARPEHEDWQGQIFSRSGKNPNYRPFSVCGLGSATGICGINCRHSFYPYFEGMEKEYTEKELDQMASEKVTYNGKTFTRYEGEQTLRGIEREIRHYKRIALTQEAAALDNTKARQKIGEWQAKARDFTKQTGIERDSAREHIGTKGKQPTYLKPKENIKVNEKTLDVNYKAIVNKYGGSRSSAIEKATKAEIETIRAHDAVTAEKREDYVKAFEKQTVDYDELTREMESSTNQKEKDALNLWSGSSYRIINNYLRNGEDVDKIYKDAADQIHKGLSKCEYPTMYVRRGASYEYIDRLFGSDKWRKKPGRLIGKNITDKGFLATTPDKKGGFDGQVMLYYKVPDRAQAAYIDSISRNKGEKETLFIDNTTMRVLEVRTERLGGSTRFIIIGDIK